MKENKIYFIQNIMIGKEKLYSQANFFCRAQNAFSNQEVLL